MTFEFATATRIILGAGRRSEVFAVAKAFGKRALVVTGRHPERAAWLCSGLEREGLECQNFCMPGEPTIELAEKGAAWARSWKADVVLAIGGGSAIDAGKAIAALSTNLGSALNYLEVIGAAQPLKASPLPFIAIPTTAGTGAEVTRNAVLSSPEHQLKVSLRSPKMLPILAVIDPELTHDLPRALTASTGLDALTQLIEPFLCNRANPMTDAICREALPRAMRALPLAFRDGSDRDARAEMAFASLAGGLALANAGLGVVHGFAAPIGGMFESPHGAICAALLPHGLEINLRAAKTRVKDDRTPRRFDELGQLLTGDPSARAEDAIECVAELCGELQVPALGTYGVARKDFDVICDRAKQASSMKANPVPLTDEELREILERAI